MFSSRIRETTSTTGTGNITLAGAVAGYQACSNEFWHTGTSIGIPFQYWIQNLAGTEIEAGIGRLTATTTLVRDASPEFTYSSGTPGSGTNVTFTAGTKYVFAAPLGRGILPTLPTINTTAGTRLSTSLIQVGTAGTAALAADTVWFMPFFHGVMDTVDAVVFCNTGGAAGNAVGGIYTMNPATGLPLSMLVSGAAASTAGTGFIASTFTAFALPPGWYYLALHKSAGGGTTRTIAGATATGAMHLPLGVDASLNAIIGHSQSTAYSGTLPAVGTLADITTGSAPALFLRIA